jgi:hypothetical protein
MELETTMTLQAGDRVMHEAIGQDMIVLGISDINGKPLAWCEWSDTNGETRRSTFPENELRTTLAAAE